MIVFILVCILGKIFGLLKVGFFCCFFFILGCVRYEYCVDVNMPKLSTFL